MADWSFADNKGTGKFVNGKTVRDWVANDGELVCGDICLEKEIFLSHEGEDIPNIVDFKTMQKQYKSRNIELSIVIDAEGEYVCIAPEPIARLIAKLLTELGNK